MKKAEIAGVVKDFAPVIREYVAEAVRPLADRLTALEARQPEHGKDGAGVSHAMIDRDGCLVLTLTDGRTLEPGRVTGDHGPPGEPGKKGEPGPPGRTLEAWEVEAALDDMVTRRVGEAVAAMEPVKGDPGPPGRDADMNEVAALIAREVEKIEPVKGDPGPPGKDGLGFEDLEEELSDDGRLIIRRYKRGSEVKEFHHRVPALIDRGVYVDGAEYAPGDVVTWAGSVWICQAPTVQKPGQADTWRLAVKRGRDGKDGKDAAPAKTKEKTGDGAQ